MGRFLRSGQFNSRMSFIASDDRGELESHASKRPLVAGFYIVELGDGTGNEYRLKL